MEDLYIKLVSQKIYVNCTQVNGIPKIKIISLPKKTKLSTIFRINPPY